MTKKDYNLIKKMIKKSSSVFITGHKDMDLDSLGSALGLYCYASFNKRKAYIIVDDVKVELGTKKVIDLYTNKVNFIKSLEIDKYFDAKSLLIVVDTNKTLLLQNPKLINKFYNIIVVDHHAIGDGTINVENALMCIDPSSSSTCEIITNMLKKDNYIIDSGVATVLLAGIVLDTNNFIIKTNYRTYYSAYYLTKSGADPKKVQYLLKQDIKQYIERQKVITEVKIIKNIAVTKGLQTEIYRREDLAKIADTILLFNNIEVSFVIGKISKDIIGISARSMGNVNVGKIMEKFSGGGDEHEAAAKIKDKSLNDILDEVVNLSKKL